MARGRIAELGAGTVGSGSACLPWLPTALWVTTGRSRTGDARVVGDLDLDGDAARRVVDSTTARRSTASCVVVFDNSASLGRCALAAALFWDGEG